ncbi:hypothetical protein VIGAN_10189300, partial [Vigna angularis var. angularis]
MGPAFNASSTNIIQATLSLWVHAVAAVTTHSCSTNTPASSDSRPARSTPLISIAVISFPTTSSSAPFSQPPSLSLEIFPLLLVTHSSCTIFIFISNASNHSFLSNLPLNLFVSILFLNFNNHELCREV